MARVLDLHHSILNRFVAQLRDQTIQKDQLRFRRNLERVGEVMAYEITKTLNYTSSNVTTPLGEAEVMLPADKVVLATILRAGVPMTNGFLNVFDDSQVAFVSAARQYHKNGEMEIDMQNVTTPSLDGAVLIIIDPMLATGTSAELTYEALIEKGGTPRHTHFASVVASCDGIGYLESKVNRNRTTVWVAAVDSDLTVRNYIVPGIGDSGDLAYGEKLSTIEK